MREIKIDFDNPGFPQRLDVVENDSQSRFFKAVLYKDGKAYAAPSGATYSIMYRGFGPQNEGWYDTINDGAGKRAACSVSGNVVTCEIARQALRVPGHVSVVLCVTGSNGYMLHGWPIDCNCRNDNYTGGTSVESFFYITQVTSADWTSAIKTWEELKNMIDPTLSVEGKAADAKATGKKIKDESERATTIENNLGSNLSYHKQLIDLLEIKNDGSWSEKDDVKKQKRITEHNANRYGVNVSDSLGFIDYYYVEAETYYDIRCVTGFSLAGILWLDSTDTVISVDAINESPTSGKYEMISGYWKSPKNCVKVKINGYKNKEPRIRKRTFKNNNVYTTYQELSVTWNTEKWYNAANKTYRNESVGLESCEIAVSRGEKYKICGYSNYEMQLYQLFSNNEIISVYPDTNTKPVYYEKEITIPENSDMLIINGFSDISDPSNPGLGNTVGKTKIYKISDKNTNKEKKSIIWVAIGDSLTEKSTLNPKVSGTPNYVDYVAKSIGATSINLGVGGTGYLANGKGYFHPFYYRVNQIPENADVVTIFGSFNDIYLSDFLVGNLTDNNNTTLYGAFNFLIQKIYERAPSCAIGIITPTPWAEANRKNATSSLYKKAIDYIDALENVAKYNSIPILNLFDESNLRPWDDEFKKRWFLNADGTHPLREAHEKFIAPKVAEFVRKLT